MSKIERLVTKKKELSTLYDLLSGKIGEIQKGLVLETSPSEKFRLQAEIERYEQERKHVEDELKAIEEIGDADEEMIEIGRIGWGVEIIIEKLEKSEIYQRRMEGKFDNLLHELGMKEP